MLTRPCCAVGLDFIQLHGHEGLHIARQLVRPVIRAVHVAAEVAPPQTTAAAVPAPVGAAAGTAHARLSVEQLLAQARTSQGPFEPGQYEMDFQGAFPLIDIITAVHIASQVTQPFYCWIAWTRQRQVLRL